MNKLTAILVATACMVAVILIATARARASTAAAGYSTEATLTRMKNADTYVADVRISQLVKRDGKLTEVLISEPRMQSSTGVPAGLESGYKPSDPNYTKKESVTVNVSWPETGKRDYAICAVVVKLGDKIVSKTKMQVTVDEKSDR